MCFFSLVRIFDGTADRPMGPNYKFNCVGTKRLCKLKYITLNCIHLIGNSNPSAISIGHFLVIFALALSLSFFVSTLLVVHTLLQ